jgi:hypothetical protein
LRGKRKFRIWLSIFLSLSLALVASVASADSEETKPAVEEVRASAVRPIYTGPTTDYHAELVKAIKDAQLAQFYEGLHQAELDKQAAAAKAKQNPKVSNPSGPTTDYSSMEPCGGDLPPCWVKSRESGGNYGAFNPTGCVWKGGRGCWGAWQFGGFWSGKLGLPLDLSTATPEQQDAAARELWAGGAGCSNWNAC